MVLLAMANAHSQKKRDARQHECVFKILFQVCSSRFIHNRGVETYKSREGIFWRDNIGGKQFLHPMNESDASAQCTFHVAFLSTWNITSGFEHRQITHVPKALSKRLHPLHSA